MAGVLHIIFAQGGGQTGGSSSAVLWAMLAIAIIIVLIFFAVMTQFINLWVQAMLSGAPVPMQDLIGMRLRKVDPRLIVLARVRVHQAGLDLSTKQLEAHYLAGGRVHAVVTAAIVAAKGGVDLSWEEICAADLAGRDIEQEVKALVQLKTAAGGQP
jgi:uncharacterized protein YqfA (UPF0365 family)